MVAAIDPETGLWTTPTPEQMRELATAAAPSPAAGVHIVQQPDGTVTTDLRLEGEIKASLRGSPLDWTSTLDALVDDGIVRKRPSIRLP